MSTLPSTRVEILVSYKEYFRFGLVILIVQLRENSRIVYKKKYEWHVSSKQNNESSLYRSREGYLLILAASSETVSKKL